MNNLKLLDCTIRDGSYCVDFKFTQEDIFNIVQGLSQANIKLIEIGHGLGIGAYRIKGKESLLDDISSLQIARKAVVNDSKIGMFCIPDIAKLEDIKDIRKEGLDFIRIGVNITEYKKAIPFLEYAKKENLEVSLNLMKSYVVNKFKFLQFAKDIDKLGIDYIYVVDSAGGMLPEDVSKIIKLLKDNIKTKIGFHGHNNLMLANANNIEAIKSGVNLIDTTLMGIGRGGGNPSTEIMLHILDRMGININVDNKLVLDIARLYISDKMTNSKINDIDIISGFAYFHSSFLSLFEEVSKDLNIDLRDLIIEVSKINKESPDRELIKKIGTKLALNCKNIYMARNVKEF